MSQRRRFYDALTFLIHAADWGALEYIEQAFNREYGAVLKKRTLLWADPYLLEFLSDPATGMILADSSGTILNIGVKMLAWHGLSSYDQIVGKSLFELFPPEVAEMRFQALTMALQSRHCHLITDTLNGQIVESLIVPFQNEERAVVAVLVRPVPMPVPAREFAVVSSAGRPRVLE